MLSCKGKCDFYKAIFIHCVDTRPLICTRQKTTFLAWEIYYSFCKIKFFYLLFFHYCLAHFSSFLPSPKYVFRTLTVFSLYSVVY